MCDVRALIQPNMTRPIDVMAISQRLPLGCNGPGRGVWKSDISGLLCDMPRDPCQRTDDDRPRDQQRGDAFAGVEDIHLKIRQDALLEVPVRIYERDHHCANATDNRQHNEEQGTAVLSRTAIPFLLKALVKCVSLRMLIRMVKFCCFAAKQQGLRLWVRMRPAKPVTFSAAAHPVLLNKRTKIFGAGPRGATVISTWIAIVIDVDC
jgi:hypothetical protein